MIANPKFIHLFCAYSSSGVSQFLPTYFIALCSSLLFCIFKIKISKNKPCENTYFPLHLCLCGLHGDALQTCPLATFSPLAPQPSVWSRAAPASPPAKMRTSSGNSFQQVPVLAGKRPIVLSVRVTNRRRIAVLYLH